MIDFVKKKALDMEAKIFDYFHIEKGTRTINPEYSSRIRLILMYLKSDNNFELRYKIIMDQLSSKDLCTVDEIVIL